LFLKSPVSVLGFFILHSLIPVTMKHLLFPFLVIATLSACEETPVASNIENNQSATIGQADTMLAFLNDQIIQSPSDPDVFLERGRYHWSKGNDFNALNDLDAALTVDSTRADIYLERAELYYKSKNFEAALDDYKKCVDLDATNTLGLIRLATMNIHFRNYEKAIQQLNQSLQQDDKLSEAYYLKGRIYKEIGDTSLSASSYQTAIEVDPNYYESYVEVALLYAKAKSDLAIEYNTTAIEIRPKSIEARYNLAIYLQETGFKDYTRYEKALHQYTKILEIDPNNASASFNTGFVYLEYLQDYDAGIKAFTDAISLLPNYTQAYYNRGLCYESLGNKNEALMNYNTALTITPTFTSAAIAKGRVLSE
jgi:tetratricopeptide (TPR) repeat protein